MIPRIVHVMVLAAVWLAQLAQCDSATFEYHNYTQFTKFLKDLTVKYPTKTYLYSIGKSIEGRDLWVMAIADSNPDKHIILRPEAKFIGKC